jgi:hypothetical protein
MSLAEYRELTRVARWPAFVQAALSASSTLPNDPEFATYWIEGGHRIREQLADDHALALFLRLMLPPYAGESITLFRGENLARWSANSVGFGWTSEIAVAQMFAAGLNAVRGGGVLLTGHFQGSAIISGPNAHSSYLGEQQFTVDPFGGTLIQSLASFPQA